MNPARRLSVRWDIPRPIWMILLSWGFAVLLIATLLSFWISKVQRDQDAENVRVQQDQDRAMCVVIDLFTAGPAPVAGPEGDRGRAVLKALTDYRGTLHCDSLPLATPRK